MKTIAQHLADALVDNGVTTVFGLPGGENVELLEALRATGIRFVLVRNESSALFMADVAARLTGVPGVALTTLGPGATNAYAGLAHAWLDRAPVLLLTAQTAAHLVGTHTHQVLDLQACFRPVTRFTAQLEPATAAATIAHALAMLRAGRPGPLHLSLDNEVAATPIQGLVPEPVPAAVPPPDAAQLAAARALLRVAERPVIVTGLGLEPERPYAALALFAEQIGAPVIDTPRSKGALPGDHALFAGTIGLTPGDPVYSLLDAADCVVAVGFDVVELVRPWRVAAPLLWISGCENHDPALPAAAELVGSIGETLALLSSGIDRPDRDGWGVRQAAALRGERPGPSRDAAPAGRVSPPALLSALRTQCPPDTIVTTDVGSHKIFTALAWPAQVPNSYFVSNGLSAMGFGVPAAIAAALMTDRPAVCITGDAGLGMVLGELSLITQYGLPVVVIVMNDSALDLIRTAQQKRRKPVFGTEFANPDYEKIAEGFGLAYRRLTADSQCGPALADIFAGARGALVEVMVDPAGYPTAFPAS